MTPQITDITGLHAALRSLLAHVDETARECGLEYWAAYGTALGAARDGDLIAWDTDCDINVPIAHLDRLVLELRRRESGGNFVIHDTSDPAYDHLFPRLSLPGVDSHFVHVDFFPIVGTFRSPRLARLHVAAGKALCVAFRLKKSDPTVRYEHDRRKRRVARLLTAALVPVPADMLRRLFDRAARLRAVERASHVVSLGGPYGKREIFPTTWLTPTTSAALGAGTIRMPHDVDLYLTQLYGKYAVPPPEHVRQRELGYFHDVILPAVRTRPGPA